MDWSCEFCGQLSPDDSYKCASCGAGKPRGSAEKWSGGDDDVWSDVQNMEAAFLYGRNRRKRRGYGK